jgi:hypothetical protein
MLASDFVQMLQSMSSAARVMEAAAPSASVVMRTSLLAAAVDLRRRATIAEAHPPINGHRDLAPAAPAPTPTPVPRLMPAPQIAYAAAAEQIEEAGIVLNEVRLACPPARLAAVLAEVDEAIGQAIVGGSKAIERGQSDATAIGSMRLCLAYTPAPKLRAAAEWSEAAPFRARLLEVAKLLDLPR